MNAWRSVGSNVLRDAGVASDAGDGPGRRMTIEPSAIYTKEQRAFAPFANREVDSASGSRSERHDHGLAALAQGREGAVSALKSERFDVRSSCLRDP